VRDGGLGEIKQRDQLTHADLAGVPAQHIDELDAYGVAERLGDARHPGGVTALDVRVDDRLAPWLPGRALALGGEFQIDDHRYTTIDSTHICQCNSLGRR
jgi:hypothetical protein